MAIATLSVNYRIDTMLAMFLRLLEADHCSRIIDLAMDEPENRAHEIAKKKGIARSAVSVSSAGDVTPPASQASGPPTAT